MKIALQNSFYFQIINELLKQQESNKSMRPRKIKKDCKRQTRKNKPIFFKMHDREVTSSFSTSSSWAAVATNYLLAESEVFTGESQTETLPYRPSENEFIIVKVLQRDKN